MRTISIKYLIPLLFAFLCIPILCIGCGDDSGEEETVQGLKEVNRVLRGEIEDLEKRLKEARGEYSLKLNDKDSSRHELELELSQLKRSYGELKSELDSDKRITSHSDNMLLYSLFFSIIFNIILMALIMILYYKIKRDWFDVNQNITSKIGRYVDAKAEVINHD
jgi:ABC-type phosphate transport system auxiliary subunit